MAYFIEEIDRLISNLEVVIEENKNIPVLVKHFKFELSGFEQSKIIYLEEQKLEKRNIEVVKFIDAKLKRSKDPQKYKEAEQKMILNFIQEAIPILEHLKKFNDKNSVGDDVILSLCWSLNYVLEKHDIKLTYGFEYIDLIFKGQQVD